MWKRGPKISTINVSTFLFRRINVLTLRTINFDPWFSQLISHSNRQNKLTRTKDSWTRSKSTFQIFILHLMETFLSYYKSRMYQSIQIHCLLINIHKSWIIMIIFLWALRINNHIICLLVIIEKLLQSIKIKLVFDILKINLTIEMMILQTAEPTNPTFLLIKMIIAVWHY